jgi:glycosyltransferase involved in cell wall biosynthesis
MLGVSVILPCFNGSHWVSKAIESVLAQSNKHFELVIVNDGSTDNSEEVIAPYLRDKRIHYVCQKNSGFSAAINRGIRESSKPLIGFIGQDDMWLPEKLELQMKYLSIHKDVHLVYSDYYSIDSDERILRMTKTKRPDTRSKQQLVTQLFLNNFIGFETVLVKRSCFDEVGFFDENMIGFSDHDMWLRIVGSYNIAHLDLPLVKKRKHSLQLSTTNIESVLEDEFQLVEKAISFYPFLKKVEQKKLSSLHYALGLALLRKGNIKEAKQELLKTIRFQPYKLKAIAAYIAPTIYSFALKYYQKISNA